MTTSAPRPATPATLLAYDCWGLLESEEIARIAWVGPDGAALVPVNYVVAESALWFRTRPDSALGREGVGGRVAVEVDQVDRTERSGWSVVVIGTAQPVAVEDVPDQVMDLRVWPAGPRTLFVRVDALEVTGRRL